MVHTLFYKLNYPPCQFNNFVFKPISKRIVVMSLLHFSLYYTLGSSSNPLRSKMSFVNSIVQRIDLLSFGYIVIQEDIIY